MEFSKKCTKAHKIIRSDLTIFSINDTIIENKIKWKDYIDRMVENRPPKKTMNFRLIRNRNLGRQRKGWLDVRDQLLNCKIKAGYPTTIIRSYYLITKAVLYLSSGGNFLKPH